jgi:nicotinate-nucleotide adenylyltransferase
VVAQDALERLGLDRLIIVPAARPPHRDPVLDAGTRFDLVRDAFGDDPRIEVSDVELRRAGPSWTVDTVECVHAERAPDILFLIVGADQLRAFGKWRRPDRILELARLAVMTRPDEEVVRTDVPYESVEVTRVDLSSTRIRRRLEEGRSVRYLVPEPLRERIQQAWAAREAARGA